MAKVKNKYGQYFTIESIADFMVSLITHNNEVPVLEPSCGKGVFLKMLKKHNYTNIHGYEIDKTLPNVFDCVKYESFVSSPLSELYDVIIGNPPYIRWKNLEEELKNELETSKLWQKYFNSLCDYLFIFILKSIEQLNQDGELIFICPEYWMNTTHSKSLRNFMTENGYLSDLFQFKEAPLFEGVTSSFVIFRYVKSTDRHDMTYHKYSKKGRPDIDELVSQSCFNKSVLPQFKKGERWILADDEERISIQSFENNCKKRYGIFDELSDFNRIGDVCDIGNGMVSGLDKAFQIDDPSSLNDYEKQLLISVYKAKDLDQYVNTSMSYYLFIKQQFSDDSFRALCPNLYSHLLLFSDKLKNRYSYGKDLKIWEFAFPRNEALFRRQEKRIFIPCKERISCKDYFRFAIADKNIFPLQDVTGILKKKT